MTHKSSVAFCSVLTAGRARCRTVPSFTGVLAALQRGEKRFCVHFFSAFFSTLQLVSVLGAYSRVEMLLPPAAKPIPCHELKLQMESPGLTSLCHQQQSLDSTAASPFLDLNLE
ncbi:hypothetical protein EK904_005341 [Melospiza melodia maxima]|nr:hypothetical protein EK904_005341 [Melospiza melodia maxima]